MPMLARLTMHVLARLMVPTCPHYSEANMPMLTLARLTVPMPARLTWASLASLAKNSLFLAS
jgi:hypothetical protein